MEAFLFFVRTPLDPSPLGPVSSSWVMAKGFRFLKDFPSYVSEIYLKKKERIEGRF